MVRKVKVVSSSGNIVFPAELQADSLESGDKVVFRTNEQGQIVIEKRSEL